MGDDVIARLDRLQAELDEIRASVMTTASLRKQMLSVTNRQGLNLRRGPHLLKTTVDGQANVIRVMDYNEVVERLEIAAGEVINQSALWYRVRDAQGNIGYAHSSHLVAVSAPMPYAPVELKRGKALVGVHGPTEVWGVGVWTDDIYQMIAQSRVEAVKILTAGADGSVVQMLYQMGIQFILARIFQRFDAQIIPARQFIEYTIPDVDRLYRAGVRWFEVHNEPNLFTEGLGKSWSNGVEFARWFNAVCDMYRQEFPEIRLGLPGLSPNPSAGLGIPGHTFYQSVMTVAKPDWIGYHVYWWGTSDASGWQAAAGQVRSFSSQVNMPVCVTEFSNPNPHIDKAQKAREYVSFYNEAYPANVHALFSFALAGSGFETETWEDSVIPRVVGERKEA
jgi:hypothetical protein